MQVDSNRELRKCNSSHIGRDTIDMCVRHMRRRRLHFKGPTAVRVSRTANNLPTTSTKGRAIAVGLWNGCNLVVLLFYFF